MVALPNNGGLLPLFRTDVLAQYMQPRKSAGLVRIGLLALISLFLYYVATSTSAPHEVVSSQAQNIASQVQKTSSNIEKSISDAGNNIKDSAPPPSLAAAVKVTPKKDDNRKYPTVPQSGGLAAKYGQEIASGAFQGQNIHTGEPFDIQKSLKAVLDIAPDEIYTRDLLRPIGGGGEEKMHETGLRSRLFKKYFDVWEALHVVADPVSKRAFVRDDVIQYLRDVKDLSGVSMKLSQGEIIEQYESFRFFMMQFSEIIFPFTAPYFGDHMMMHSHMYHGGRGIVFSGGDSIAPYIATSIGIIRRLGCDLPVEVLYMGNADLSEDARQVLELLPGVTTRNLNNMVAEAGWDLSGFGSKAFSIIMSSFREVLFVDADALFMQNPELLFEHDDYQETGAVFFRDRIVNPEFKKQFLRAILPKPISDEAKKSYYWTGESAEMQESGVILVDKWRHFVSLLLVARMNGPDRPDSEGGRGTYSFFYGDKETFWVGFELAGDTDYRFHQGNCGNMGVPNQVQRWMILGPVGSGNVPPGEEKPPEEKPTTSSILAAAPSGLTGLPNLDLSDSYRAHAEEEHKEQASTDNPSESKASQEDFAASLVAKLAAISKAGTTTNTEVAGQPLDLTVNTTTPEQIDNRHLQGGNNGDTPEPNLERNIEAFKTKTEMKAPSTKRADEPPAEEAGVDMEYYSETVGGDIFSVGDFFDMVNVNYTMCSPQLLHLDLAGRPLWFNGWIQEDKFNHDKNVAVSRFEMFAAERREDGEAGHWELGDHNRCCLKTDKVWRFTESEREVLDMMVTVARENGALA